MNRTITSIAALAFLAAGQAYASAEFDNHATSGTILLDLDKSVAVSGDYAPSGHLVSVIDSADSYGSVLFDLDRASPAYRSSPPSIGDDADDYGNILYDTGSIY